MKQVAQKSSTKHLAHANLTMQIAKRNITEQVGLSRATLEYQVKVFHFDLIGLPYQSIQWVNNSRLFKEKIYRNFFVFLTQIFSDPKVFGYIFFFDSNF